MKKVSDILPKVIKKREIDSNATASHVLETAEQYLRDIFGTDNVGQGKNITGQKLQNGLVFFAVSSSAWNNRLFMEKMGLLEFLQGKFPALTLRDVRGKVRGGK